VTPDRPALIFGGSGEVVTYGQLSERSNRCAHLLRRLGLQRGTHVAILIENHPRFMEIAWAAHNAGLYLTPISWRFQPEEIAFILEDCGAQLLILTAQHLPLLPALRQRLPAVRYLVIGAAAEGCESYEASIAACPVDPIADESRGSDMVYSSGSTGRPKGVKQQLRDSSIDQASAMFQVYERRFGWGVDTIYLMPAPLYHAGPLRFAMTMQHVGATLVIMERFDALHALRLCERYRVTDAHWVPTMLVRILKLPLAEREHIDRSSVIRVIHGAGPIAPEVKHEAIAWLGPILEESYGGTEGNGLTMISSAEWLAHPGSVGRAYVGSLHVLDEHGAELPPGQQGLVYFAGGPTFEYHGNPARTREAYDAKGRSTLGDIGYLDADGYLYLTDRKNNMIVTGGVNVFPQEIEHVLITHPRVMDVAVFGLPDLEMGETIKAVVQPCDMAEAGAALASELIALCRSRLAHYKAPRSIDFRAQLPRHDTGKIYTRLLKDEYLRAGGGH
jgi:acyl-CoA synthetase (AMP-forming)/AMP-acid ligase II